MPSSIHESQNSSLLQPHPNFASRIWRTIRHPRLDDAKDAPIQGKSACNTGAPLHPKAMDNSIHTLSTLKHLKRQILAGTMMAFDVVCDLLVTAAMCYYLVPFRTEFRRWVYSRLNSLYVRRKLTNCRVHRHNSLVNALLLFTLNRGLLVSAMQICVLAMFVRNPLDPIW